MLYEVITPQGEEDPSQTLPGAPMVGQGECELGGRQQAPLDQILPEAGAWHGRILIARDEKRKSGSAEPT